MSAMLEPRRVAELEEGRLIAGVRDIAEEYEAWCGGVMCFGGRGSWANQVLAPCLGGQVATRADVEHMAEWYERRGAEAKVQVVPFADGSLVHELGEAGFRVREFESVFVCGLDGDWARAGGDGGAGTAPEGIEIGVADRDDEALVEQCVRVMAGAFVREPTEELLRSTRRMATYPRITTLAAVAGGRVVGVGQMEIAGEIAGMCGAGVVEAYRRRGIQGALMRERLRIAREHGCAIMTVTTFPGIATERNAMRHGFMPSYMKAILVRTGEGLVASP